MGIRKNKNNIFIEAVGSISDSFFQIFIIAIYFYPFFC